MQYTTNFNLNKPEGTDIYNIQNENDNMDIIDAALAKAHSTDDSASTDLADGDYLPFYDTSATEKKKMLLSTARKDVRARIAEAVSNDVIETIGAKALNSYSIGQYFLGNDGYYYVATAAITANTTTLNSGVSGNCSKTSIAAGMNNLVSQISNISKDLESKSINSGITNVSMIKTGNVISLVLNGVTVSSGAVGSVPNDYRPLSSTTTIVRVRDSAERYHAGLCTVATNGNITVSTFVPESTSSSGAPSGIAYGSLAYII